MVKAVEDGARLDATGELWRARNGLLLADALVRPCLIVEDDERGEQRNLSTIMRHRFIRFTELLLRSSHLPWPSRFQKLQAQVARAAWAC